MASMEDEAKKLPLSPCRCSVSPSMVRRSSVQRLRLLLLHLESEFWKTDEDCGQDIEGPPTRAIQ